MYGDNGVELGSDIHCTYVVEQNWVLTSNVHRYRKELSSDICCTDIQSREMN